MNDKLIELFGEENFNKLNEKYSGVLKYIEDNSIIDFQNCFLDTNISNIEERFLLSFRKYCNLYGKNPSFLTELGFKIIDRINNIKDLMECDQYTIIKDGKQAILVETFNIENIKRLEQETSLFSANPIFLELLANSYDYYILYIKDSLSYSEFLDNFAKVLDNMRRNNVFSDYPDYDVIRGSFRENHPEIFMDLNAPANLRRAFYQNHITAKLLHKHKEYIPYLVDKNLENVIKDIIICYYKSPSEDKDYKENFIFYIQEKFGSLKCLEIISKYGFILDKLEIPLFKQDLTLEEIEKQVRRTIYEKIRDLEVPYQELASVEEFRSEYPMLFADFSLLNISNSERERLELAYYSKSLTFEDIKKCPELIEILKDKDLRFNFQSKINPDYFSTIRDIEILDYIDTETFLALCLKYGNYLTDNLALVIKEYLMQEKRETKYSKEEIEEKLQYIIARECSLGNCLYDEESAPLFLKEQYKELFLDSDAPPLLKKVFYNYGNNFPLTFYTLSNNKAWLPYLKGKSISTAILRGCGRGSRRKREVLSYFNLFGEGVAIKLGINKPETVSEMIGAYQVSVMKKWYEKTGGKFIPDYIVMQNMPLEDADKFLTSSLLWSKLMRIKDFTDIPESRDVLLKLAYSFGVFDGDSRGYKKLYELLTDIPRKIKEEDLRGIINIIDFDFDTKKELHDAFKEEKVPFTKGYDFFKQIYKLENGVYTLTINPEQYPKTTKAIRKIFNEYPEIPILNPFKAQRLFGEFSLQYDPDFREFLLANLDKILDNSEYAGSISRIQRQFRDIKTFNSNRHLTLELALSYVQSNRYENVEVGNNEVALVSAIAGYSEEDFRVLQQIYNYGKQRVFSSIPRIENQTEKYSYELLRLSDPLALAIGTLTNCCQELNSMGEGCMEHSMTSKDGRIFVIRDKDGNIVAQSWVWRNKDVLCFDNIEVSDKQMHLHGIPRGLEDTGIRNEFTDEILEIYKKAAQEIIKKDEEVYQDLFAKGKISKEQYEGLRLKKITVGLGYSNIKGSLKTLVVDESISRPLPYTEPIKLKHGLYTADSTTQYILEEEARTPYQGSNLAIHHDSYIEYQDSNFNEKLLLTLQKLEIITKNSNYLETEIDEIDEEHIVTCIARNYNLNPLTTRIILHPNFAIIYDSDGDNLRIADLFYNFTVKNMDSIEDKVLLQIRVALNQISKNKQMDISALNPNQRLIIEKSLGLDKEIDIERGISNAR